MFTTSKISESYTKQHNGKLHWIPRDEAIDFYLSYERLYGKRAAQFACYAAFPLIVSPELVNLIRINFFEDGSESTDEWLYETDFLLTFCRPYDSERQLYRIDPGIREVLLDDLVDSTSDPTILYRLAGFLLAYVENQPLNDQKAEVRRVHQWMAWALLSPEDVLKDILNILNKSSTQSMSTSKDIQPIIVSNLMDIISEPLSNIEPFLRKKFDQTEDELSKLVVAYLDGSTHHSHDVQSQTASQRSSSDQILSLTSNLSRDTFAELYAAFANSYGNAIDMLSRLVKHEFEQDLEVIAGRDQADKVIVRLLEWAERTGNIESLLRYASLDDPSNDQFKVWFKKHSKSLDTIYSTTKGDSTERLQQALYSAFPQKGQLEILTGLDLSEDLDDIALGNTYVEQIRHLIEWAYRTEKFEHLVVAALRDVPSNPLLQNWIDQNLDLVPSIATENNHFSVELLDGFPTTLSRELFDILVSHFNWSELAQLVRWNLNVDLASITNGHTLAETVYQVIRWADANHQLRNLASYILEERSASNATRTWLDRYDEQYPRSEETRSRSVLRDSTRDELSYYIRELFELPEFKRLLRTFDKNPNDLSLARSYRQFLDDVIADSERKGWITELLTMLSEARPDNTEFRNYTQNINDQILRSKSAWTPTSTQINTDSASLTLSGVQHKEFEQLIRRLFKPNELKRLLMYELEINLDDISLMHNYETLVFDIISDAESKGWLPELIDILSQSRPEDPSLRNLSKQFNLSQDNTSQKSQRSRLQNNNPTFLLTGIQRKELSLLIRSLFTPQQLRRGLMFGLEIDINNITTEENYEAIVFDVIDDAEKQRWTDRLLIVLREARPEDTRLLAFSQQLDSQSRNPIVNESPPIIGKLKEQLSALIRSNFTPKDLQTLLAFELDVKLADITTENDFEAVVFDLILYAEEQSWILDLINSICVARPESIELLEFFAEFKKNYSKQEIVSETTRETESLFDSTGNPIKMRVNGTQYKQLSHLIRQLFEPGELKRMLMFALDINISNITLADNYEAQAFDVIGDSQLKGWTPRLINALREARPGDATLLAFSQQFDLAPLNTPSRSALEKLIVDSNSFLDVARWRTNLGRIERQVCAIRLNGKPAGTGFLLGPDVIMTNYHVVNDVIDQKISPQSVSVIFDFKQMADGTALSQGSSYELADDWLIDHSPYSQVDLVPLDKKNSAPQPDELDYALLRLKQSPGNDVFGDPQNPGSPTRGWLKPQIVAHDFFGKPALFIVQYPKGKPLKLALDTQAVLDVNANQTRVIYRTNTDPGSSGSPCFDQDWNLVALHHSGDPAMMPTWNEGIPFTAIMQLLEERGKADALDNSSPTDFYDVDDIAASLDNL